MKRIKIIILSSLLTLLVFATSQGFAINPQPEPPGGKAKTVVAPDECFVGTVVKVEGNTVTVRDEKGVERIVTGKFTGLKVGGKVKVTTKNGLTWLNPQPEPPLPSKAKPLAQ